MRGVLPITYCYCLAMLAACGSKPDDEFFDPANQAAVSFDGATASSTSQGGGASSASITAGGTDGSMLSTSGDTASTTTTASNTTTTGSGGSGGNPSDGDSTNGSSDGNGGATATVTTGATTTGGGGDPGSPNPLLDDFEDADIELPALGAPPRVGQWYYYYDHAPDRELAANPVMLDGSLVMHVSGWTEQEAEFAYGGLAVDLHNPGGLPDSGMRTSYDLGAYDGITFRGRGGGSLRVEILTADVAPSDRGGTCTQGDACGDAHYELMALSGEWQEYTIQFDGLIQAGWGAEFSFNRGRVLNVAFEYVGTGEYEFWVDDVMLYAD